MIKALFDKMEIDILNIERYRVGREWNHRNVNSPYTRLYMILDGEGYVTLNKKEYLLEPGCLYLLPAFTNVDLACPETFLHYYIHLTTGLENGLNICQMCNFSHKTHAKEHNISESIFDRLIELNPNLELLERDATKRIYQSILDRARKLASEKSVSNIIESNGLIRILLAAFMEKTPDTNISSASTGISKIQPALRYIHENLDKHITLEDLADVVDLNPSYMSDVFSKAIGISPIKYINRKRIENAQALLLSTRLTLYEIARKVGFSDEYYFSRTFNKIVGQPPGKYRRMFDLSLTRL